MNKNLWAKVTAMSEHYKAETDRLKAVMARSRANSKKP
jgi:hypothetical protein